MTTDNDVERIEGISLQDHAEISAEIAEGDRKVDDVLGVRGLSQERWGRISLAWMQRLADDVKVHREHARLPMAYADAFGRAQNAKKAVPPMSVEEWAALTVQVTTDGGPQHALRARGLSQADYLRLARHWANVLSTDPVAARRYEKAFAALQPAPIEG
jgi:hypothetical protein